MRTPEFETDGWELRNSLEFHLEHPETFAMPPEADRAALEPGDFAKLVFEISVDDEADSLLVERMWVVVRETADGRYFGLLDNEPDVDQNDEFWVGTEVPFGPEHVIEIQKGDAASRNYAARVPLRSWPRA